MKDSPTEELKKEDLIKELMKLVFKKVKKDSKETTPYGISQYLNKKLNNKINERTLTRYYGYYIQSNGEKTTPNNDYLDLLSKYLDFKDFKDFEVRKEYEKENKKLKERLKRIKKISILLIAILLFISILFIVKYYKKNCMIWTGNKYEKIRCSGLDMEKKLDLVVLKNFKKVDVCKDSIFFKNGEPIKHYLRYKNKVEFFTHPGEHPIYDGKFLHPITKTIIDNHVKPCDFNSE